TRLDDLDESTVEAAKLVVLDTIGAILAGSRQDENAKLALLATGMSGAGSSSILGHVSKVQPGFATLVNGTAGVALEMDEGNRQGGGHASIHVMPSALAMAEAQGLGGEAFLESVIVGYEVTSRIGGATLPKQQVHSHGTWGTIGTAALTARLLGYDASETRQAMNMAMSMSPANTWTPCLEGATVRNLYPGRSGFQGILAANLVRCGFTAIDDGPTDLYSNLIGEGFVPEAVVDGLGQPKNYRIQQNYFKLHACCLYNHPVLDAFLSITRTLKFSAEEVEEIRVEAPPLALIMADPAPENMLAAKFSIPYAVAASLIHETTDVTAFYPDKVDDPRVRELARKVRVLGDPDMSLRRFDYPAARVTVRLQNGHEITDSVTAHRGDTLNPVPKQELIEKFKFLANDALGEEGAGRVVDLVDRLESLADIKELTANL
ncbi:MAG TPA: MmgE/PrpD family protein, partial [Dehalococcoidia bacterium]|nr:MmgE/PrpD family protein [Dehalococcoidia bacterium]